MESLPQSYAELSRWFPSLADRARVLGLSRQTLTTWERAPDEARLRAATASLVDRLALFAGDVEERVGTTAGTRAWITAPQPLEEGRTPAELLRDGRDDALRRLIFPADDGGAVREVSLDREALARTLPQMPLVKRERSRPAREADVLRRVGEREDLIGPVRE